MRQPIVAEKAVFPAHHRRRISREAVAAWSFLTPNLVGFLVFVVGPVVASFILSFTRYDLLTPPKFIGLRNYATLLLHDPLMWQSLGNTLYYSALTIPTGIVISLALALALNQGLRGTIIYRTLYFLPVVTSAVAIAFIWKWLYNPDYGLLNWVLSLFNSTGPDWLNDPNWAMPSIGVAAAWKGMGYNMVIFLAGLQAIPAHLYEAAKIDGASTWKRFVHITLPLLSPSLFFVAVISVIGSFQVFDQVYVMTGGGPNNATLVYNYYLWQNTFQYFKMGYASAMAYVLFALIFVVTLIQFRLLNRRVVYDAS
jgi:multiple sugar transport system permease protein